jgi:hypothetical protein
MGVNANTCARHAEDAHKPHHTTEALRKGFGRVKDRWKKRRRFYQPDALGRLNCSTPGKTESSPKAAGRERKRPYPRSPNRCHNPLAPSAREPVFRESRSNEGGAGSRHPFAARSESGPDTAGRHGLALKRLRPDPTRAGGSRLVGNAGHRLLFRICRRSSAGRGPSVPFSARREPVRRKGNQRTRKPCARGSSGSMIQVASPARCAEPDTSGITPA